MRSGKDPAREALALTDQSKQQVLGLNRDASELARFVAGKKQHPPGSFGITLEHPPPPCWLRRDRSPPPLLSTLYGQTSRLHVCNSAKSRKNSHFGVLDSPAGGHRSCHLLSTVDQDRTARKPGSYAYPDLHNQTRLQTRGVRVRSVRVGKSPGFAIGIR